ncbi:MAG: extracellular solute-binding protein [Chloroflexi bacterium]|nr:extracellular solute-binding protein [Chloroflexota bacterium]
MSIVLLVMVGCASSSPVPLSGTPTPVASAPSTSAPASMPAPTGDAEWAKVVAEAQKEGKVNIYTFWITGDASKAVADAFEKRYGIKVEMVTGVGSVLIERIKTEQIATKYVADTFDSAISLVAMAKEQGLLQKWGYLPILSEKDVWRIPPRVDAEDQIVDGGVGHVTTMVNTSLVKSGDEPKSFKDFLDPKWGGGKISIASPVTAPVSIMAYVAKMVDDDFFIRLGKNNPKIGPTVRDSINAVARSEAAVEFLMTDSITATLVARGAPLKAIELTEGALRIHGLTITLAKNAPHANAARVFTNWLLSREGQEAYHKASSSTPVRKDMPSFMPAAVTVDYKKVTNLGLEDMLKVSKIQGEGTVAKLLGLMK